MAEQRRQGISLNPDDFVAGGLIDDFDGVITLAKFDRYDFEGKSDVERPCLYIEGITKDGDPFNQHYSAGDIKRLVPSDDGEELIPVGESAAALVKSTNMAQLLASLVNNGFPREKLSGRKISIIKGLHAHFLRVAQPKRDNLPGKEGENKVSQVLVVSKILSLPWEPAAFTPAAPTSKVSGPGVSRNVPAGAPAAAAAAPAATAAAPASSGELDSKAEGYLIQLVAENGGALTKAAIPGKLFQVCGKDPAAGQILVLANSADWLANPGRPWKYDSTTMTLSL